jgi:hypothetical protein
MRLDEQQIYWLADKLAGTTQSLKDVWKKGEPPEHETLCTLSELICQCKCGEWFWWPDWDESPKNGGWLLLLPRALTEIKRAGTLRGISNTWFSIAQDTIAMTRKGLPEPPTIFNGAAMTIAPVGGS